VVTAVDDVVLLEEVEVEVEVDVLVLVDVLVVPVTRGPRNENPGKNAIRLKFHVQKRLKPLKKNVKLKTKNTIRPRDLSNGRHCLRHINKKN